MKIGLAWLTLIVALTLTAIGCGGGGGSASASGSGTLRVWMADAPDPSITSVEVDIDRIEAHLNGNWQVVSDADQTVDLMTLVENDMVIGQAVVAAGTYNQIRLIVTGGRVTDDDGTHDLQIPSGIQTGIKINLNFDVDANVLTEILLDFNVQKSIVKQGNGVYRLQPVIPAVIKVLSGTITGVATDGVNPLHNATVKAIYTAGTNYPIGTEVNETSTLEDGGFKVWALLAGTYSLELTWTDPNDPNVVITATVANVDVVASQNSDVGSVVLQ